MCRSCDRQDGDVISTQCSGGNNLWAAWFVLFNPRLNLSEVSRRRGLWAKITTKKVSINKIFILLLLKNMILMECCLNFL